MNKQDLTALLIVSVIISLFWVVGKIVLVALDAMISTLH